jgi:hypothetical protein
MLSFIHTHLNPAYGTDTCPSWILRGQEAKQR